MNSFNQDAPKRAGVSINDPDFDEDRCFLDARDNVTPLRPKIVTGANRGAADEPVTLPAPTKGDTRILNRVFDHPAFGDLNSYAVHVFLLLHRRHRHPGVGKDGTRWQGNNGRIALSRVEVAKICGIDRKTATKALQALVDGNFIREMKPAKFNGQEWSAPEWRINHLPCVVTGKGGSFAFKRCKPAVSRRNPA